MEITRDLLLRHDVPGPRYTSYPTVPEWGRDFTPEHHAAALERASQVPEPLSLYVHLPFCAARCLYCGCNTIVPRDRTPLASYLDDLDREIARVAELLGSRRRVCQMHWGGGTPNYLEPEELRRLFEAVTNRFVLVGEAELAVEIDPCTVREDHLDTFAALGFNRVSMGVQDLSASVQEAVGRHQTEEVTRRVFEKCRSLGFGGINMDLIYGLPLQEPNTWAETLRTVAALGPDRVAVYGFAFLPERLPHQQALAAYPAPTGPEKYALFAQARNALLAAGYRPIGMDHFARPDDELCLALDRGRLGRNFMGYTVAAAPDQIGFGLSAISEAGGAYAQNHKELPAYHAALAEGGLPTALGIALTEDDLLRRWVIRELMCNFALDFGALERRFGVRFAERFAEERPELDRLAGEGFVRLEEDALHVLPLGAVFVRNICMAFDRRLRRNQSPSGFSRTI